MKQLSLGLPRVRDARPQTMKSVALYSVEFVRERSERTTETVLVTAMDAEGAAVYVAGWMDTVEVVSVTLRIPNDQR